MHVSQDILKNNGSYHSFLCYMIDVIPFVTHWYKKESYPIILCIILTRDLNQNIEQQHGADTVLSIMPMGMYICVANPPDRYVASKERTQIAYSVLLAEGCVV
jgi:hypothetical protein